MISWWFLQLVSCAFWAAAGVALWIGKPAYVILFLVIFACCVAPSKTGASKDA